MQCKALIEEGGKVEITLLPDDDEVLLLLHFNRIQMYIFNSPPFCPRCPSDADLGFPSFTSGCSTTGPGLSGMSYLKTSPYNLGIMTVDSLHQMGYPPGKLNACIRYIHMLSTTINLSN